MKLPLPLSAELSCRLQRGVGLAAIGMVVLIGYLHLKAGLAYEFHLFFIAPVALVGWLATIRHAYLIATLTVLLWYLADRQLAGDSTDPWPLLFNTAVRLGIFIAIVWLLGQLRDVLARESKLAREDGLTGLANRRGFQLLGQSLLALARRQQMPVSALFIDLDHFKEVNDSLGHDVGDAVLGVVATGLGARRRSGDLIGRLGGDEFALILPGTGAAASRAYAEALNERLLLAMREHGWPVTFSIGVVSFATAPEQLSTLLNEADRLMYEAKNAGRNCIRCGSPDETP